MVEDEKTRRRSTNLLIPEEIGLNKAITYDEVGNSQQQMEEGSEQSAGS